MDSRFRPEEDEQTSIRETIMREASEVGSAAITAIGDRIEKKLVYREDQLKATPPTDRGLVGRRVVVPPEEIHVVTGAGRTWAKLNKEVQIFGMAAKKPTVYWMNKMTSVIALKTTAFPVSIEGVDIYETTMEDQYTRYFADVDLMVKLDPENAHTAASLIGSNIQLLMDGVTQVATAQLRNVAAQHPLKSVMQDRNLLKTGVEEGIRNTLKGVGYTLVNLEIGAYRGHAVEKQIELSTANVTKEATSKINESELETTTSNNERKRTEAGIKAETEKVTAAEQYNAEQANAIAETNKKENVSARANEFDLAEKTRSLALAVKTNEVEMRQVELTKAKSTAEAKSAAEVADVIQERAKALALQATLADAERLAEEASKRLEREDLQASKGAERDKLVKSTNAKSEAEALAIKTEADTKAELLKADRDAEAAVKKATADKQRAEATRALEAAAGLAQTDVENRKVEIAGNQVKVDKERGLAEAEIAKQKAEAEIALQRGLLEVELDRQSKLAELFAQNPALVDLERMKLEHNHEVAIEKIRAEARLAAFQAMAPHMNLNVHLIGDGGKVSQLMGSIMQIAYGLDVVGDQVPLVGNLVHGEVKAEIPGGGLDISMVLGKILPYVQGVVREMKPRMFSTLTVSDLVDHLVPVLEGKDDLLSAVNGIRESATFRMIADLPVKPILEKFGVKQGIDDSAIAAETA